MKKGTNKKAKWYYKIPPIYRELLPKDANLNEISLAASFVWLNCNGRGYNDHDFWEAIHCSIIGANQFIAI